MYDLVIRNGRIVTPERVFRGDIAVRQGKIAAVCDTCEGDAAQTIDASGMLLLPGALDSHAHLNDPGYLWREDFKHGSSAAAVGGVTTIIDMPLQNEPALTSVAVFAAKEKELADRSVVDYAFWGGMVDNLDELEGLDKAGVVSFKAFIGPVSPDYSSVNMGQARQALQRLRACNALGGFHCEDFSIIKAEEARARTEGRDTRQGFFETRPVVAELIATQSIIALCRDTGARVHICHVSHPRVAEAIRQAQAEGLPVSGETCPHYLVFTEDDMIEKGTIFKCAPPLRKAADRDRLWDYVADGTLSCLGSDHSPCRADEKDESSHGVLGAWGGISGIQSLVQVFFDQAVVRRGLSPSLLARNAAETARVFSLDHCKGRLDVGLDADIVLLDPEKEWEITADSLHYVNRISAFIGLKGKGLPVCTLVRGRVVARDGSVQAPFGYGKLIKKGCRND